jgi:hypothetical protein
MPGWHVVLVVVGCALALSMERTVAVAAFVAVPLAATAVEAVLRTREKAPRDALPRQERVVGRATAVWAAAALAGILVAAPVAAARAHTPVAVPVALAPRLAALPQGTRVLVDGDTSGWLMYAAPQLRPVYDLRVESYTAHQVEDFIGAMSADPGWDAYVRDRGVTVALVPSDSPIGAALVEQDRWAEVGRDHGHVLLQAPR